MRTRGHMDDEASLRERARAAIRSGALPHRRPERTWGGHGSGASCTICRAPVTRQEVEIEVEFAHTAGHPGGRQLTAHSRCFAAWEAECRLLERAKRSSSEASALPQRGRFEPLAGSASEE
jgi:hypothetical protein